MAAFRIDLESLLQSFSSFCGESVRITTTTSNREVVSAPGWFNLIKGEHYQRECFITDFKLGIMECCIQRKFPQCSCVLLRAT